MVGEMVKNRVGQGCIFHVIIPGHHTFSENFISPPPLFFPQEKISSKNAVWQEWEIPVFQEDNDKNLGESFALGHE